MTETGEIGCDQTFHVLIKCILFRTVLNCEHQNTTKRWKYKHSMKIEIVRSLRRQPTLQGRACPTSQTTVLRSNANKPHAWLHLFWQKLLKNLEKFGESQSHRNKITLSVSFVVIAGIWLDSANPMINNGSTCIHCRGASWWTRSIAVIMNIHFKICKTAPMKNCRNFRIPSSAKDKALEISVWIAITVVLSRCSYVWKTYSSSETP